MRVDTINKTLNIKNIDLIFKILRYILFTILY